MEKLAEMLEKRRFVLVMSHRQSGKTTTANYVARSMIPDTIMLSFALYNSSRCLWDSLLKQLHGLRPSQFANPVGPCSAEDFMGAVKGQGMHLIIDEADVLLEGATNETITDFLQTMRTLKQNEDYKLYGVVLLGTHRLTKMLASRIRSVSPFTAENVIIPPRFEEADVVDLLGQFCTLHAIGGDSPEIAKSIMEWTEGHVGLVGCCLHLLEEKVCSGKTGTDIRFVDWVAFADASLSELVWGGAVFEAISYQLGTLAADDGGVLRSLKRLMTQASCPIDDPDIATELLSLGLVVEKTVDGRPALGISSPLMRALLLARMKVPSVDVTPLGTGSAVHAGLDFKLVRLAVSRMSAGNIVATAAANSNNHPSEYAYQFEFLAQCSAFLVGWFPGESFRFIPEAKAKDAQGERRRRLDLFIYNGVKLGFELLASPRSQDDITEHFNRSEYYARTHKLDHMVVLHFTTSEEYVAYFPRASVEIADGGVVKICPVSIVHVVHDARFTQAKLYHDRGLHQSPIVVDIPDRTWQFVFKRRQ
jgi:hypothetical protein